MTSSLVTNSDFMRLNWYPYHIIKNIKISAPFTNVSMVTTTLTYIRAYVTMSSDTQRPTHSTMDDLKISINNARTEKAMEKFKKLFNLGTNCHTTSVLCTVLTMRYCHSKTGWWIIINISQWLTSMSIIYVPGSPADARGVVLYD